MSSVISINFLPPSFIKKILTIEIFILFWFLSSNLLIYPLHKIKVENSCHTIIKNDNNLFDHHPADNHHENQYDRKFYSLCPEIIQKGINCSNHHQIVFENSSMNFQQHHRHPDDDYSATKSNFQQNNDSNDDENFDKNIKNKSTSFMVEINDGEVLISSENNDDGDNNKIIKICKLKNDIDAELGRTMKIISKFTIVIKALVILMAGFWMDKMNGRTSQKQQQHQRWSICGWMIMVSTIGEFLNTIVIFLMDEMSDGISFPVGLWIAEMITAFSGGRELLMMGVYYYLTLTSREENRTFRFSFIPIVTSNIFSDGWSEIVFNYFGSGVTKKIFMYALPTASITLAMLYIIYNLNNDLRNANRSNKNDVADDDTDDGDDDDADVEKNSQGIIGGNKKNCLHMGLFDSDSKSSYNCVIVRRRKHDKKSRFLYLLLAIFLITIPPIGESQQLFIEFLSSKGLLQRFDQLKSFNRLASVVFGATILTSFLSKFSKIPDTILAIFSLGLSIVSKPILLSAKTDLDIFYADGIDCFNIARHIASYSLITKLVRKSELGRVFALLSIFSIISEQIIPWIIEITSLQTKFFPGMIFLLSEAFLIPAFILFVLTMASSNRDEIKKNKQFLRLICCKWHNDDRMFNLSAANHEQSRPLVADAFTEVNMFVEKEIDDDENSYTESYTEKDIMDALAKVECENFENEHRRNCRRSRKRNSSSDDSEEVTTNVIHCACRHYYRRKYLSRNRSKYSRR